MQKSAQDVEKEQEEMLRAKYGGLQPKKKLMPKVSTTSLNMMQGTLDKWPKFKGKCMRLAPPVPPSEGLLPDDPVAMHAQNICCHQYSALTNHAMHSRTS